MKIGGRPNVLVVTIDCLRPDYLGCYDSTMEGVAPTIDSLARSGHQFTNAVANASQTPLSFPSIFTANYPLSLGGPLYLDEDRTFVAEWFRTNGYHTVGFSTNHWLSFMSNYPRGFDEYEEYYQFAAKVRDHAEYLIRKAYRDGKTEREIRTDVRPVVRDRYRSAIDGCESYLDEVEWESNRVRRVHEELTEEYELLEEDFDAFLSAVEIDVLDRGPVESVKQSLKWRAKSSEFITRLYNATKQYVPVDDSTRNKPMTDAETVTDDVIEFLGSRGEDSEPVYLWMHYMDAHRPYLPGSRQGWEAEFQEYLEEVGEEASLEAANKQSSDVSEALYKACIRYIDEQVERLVDHATSLERETVIVLTADHGEEFREHGQIDHNAKLFDELIRVPLVVSRLGESSGEVHDELVSHVDLLPTIYSRCIPDATVPSQIDGQDVLTERRSAVVSETLRTANSPENPHHVGQHLETDFKRIAARTNEEKLIHYEDTDSWDYYDLVSDPGEQDPRDKSGGGPLLRTHIEDRVECIEQDLSTKTDTSRGETPEIVKDHLEDLGYKM